MHNIISDELLTEHDISHLPGAVRRYITITGAVGKPKVSNFRAEFEGGIRSKSSDPYMKLKTDIICLQKQDLSTENLRRIFVTGSLF